MTRHVVRLAAAVLLTAAVGLAVSAPARAASCPTSHGVTVVVDFHELGGGAESACDAGGAGKTALTQLTDVGHRLTFVQRQPGFVCRVDGAPASDPCVNTPPADAYWSLWWSDGTSGRWVYSSAGAGALTVPDGGYVALSWQGSGGKAPPGVTPTAHPAASPTSAPTSAPTPSPTHRPRPSRSAGPVTSPTSSAPAAPSSAATSGPTSASAHPTHHASSGRPSPTPSGGAASATARAEGPPDTSAPGSGSGLPGWVAPSLVVVLFVAAGAVTVVRRRRAGGGG